ncbi:unnamed protein product [Amoebophrya sp. A120]|nr:unnamed protein product [Amoebophrya sp. A120]|eukprot:GSA120T00019634001.1
MFPLLLKRPGAEDVLKRNLPRTRAVQHAAFRAERASESEAVRRVRAHLQRAVDRRNEVHRQDIRNRTRVGEGVLMQNRILQELLRDAEAEDELLRSSSLAPPEQELRRLWEERCQLVHERRATPAILRDPDGIGGEVRPQDVPVEDLEHQRELQDRMLPLLLQRPNAAEGLRTYLQRVFERRRVQEEQRRGDEPRGGADADMDEAQLHILDRARQHLAQAEEKQAGRSEAGAVVTSGPQASEIAAAASSSSSSSGAAGAFRGAAPGPPHRPQGPNQPGQLVPSPRIDIDPRIFQGYVTSPEEQQTAIQLLQQWIVRRPRVGAPVVVHRETAGGHERVVAPLSAPMLNEQQRHLQEMFVRLLDRQEWTRPYILRIAEGSTSGDRPEPVLETWSLSDNPNVRFLVRDFYTVTEGNGQRQRAVVVTGFQPGEQATQEGRRDRSGLVFSPEYELDHLTVFEAVAQTGALPGKVVWHSLESCPPSEAARELRTQRQQAATAGTASSGSGTESITHITPP